jgi:precorrin-3B C17-methyltransferase
MRQEVERCRSAIDHALQGKTTAIISSGDPGIYGMAGLAIELASQMQAKIDIKIIPGVTAASAAGAALGAPLMIDFAVISLSDLLVPWELIQKRLKAVAECGLVTVLYNPKSMTRIEPFEKMLSLFRAIRPGNTPVGIVTRVSDETEQSVVLSSLDNLDKEEITMNSVVVIGNDQTLRIGGWLVAHRGYEV